MADIRTLGEFIVEKQSDFPHASGELSSLLGSIKLAAKIVNREINKAGLVDITGAAGDQNVQGEEQQKLDVYANDKFKAALEARDQVCGIASEEEDNAVGFDKPLNLNAKYVVLMDPLDGSSNIDVNVSVGTIFSIYRRVSPVGSPRRKKIFYNPVASRLRLVMSYMALQPCWFIPLAMVFMALPMILPLAAFASLMKI